MDAASRDPQTGGGAAADAGSAIQPGAAVGPYVILGHIGRGGMGEVFLGNDRRLRRKVALKCLLGSVPRDVRREHILHEARAAASINHPNVAAIYDVLDQDDRMFIVMEYVDGETLAARLGRERLSIDAAIAIGRQLAAALAAAHAQGVIHRDLKPANIQLTPQGGLKVLDFGIANAAYSLTTLGDSDTTRATTEMAAPVVRTSQPGTPAYMSPEQLLNRPVDQRSDIFSLGVVLFEMATGRRPFLGASAASLAVAITDGAPRADAIYPAVPRRLADIIAKALSVDPVNRYQSAVEIEEALDALTASAPAAGRGIGELARTAAIRAAIGVPIAFVLLGAIGLVATMGFNTTFGRDGGNARFGVEPWPAYFVWGARALFPSLVIMTLTAVAAMAVRFVFSLLAVFGPIARMGDRLRRSMRSGVAAAGLDTPATVAQALCLLGAAVIALFLFHHRALISAWTGLFNTSDIARLWPMRENSPERLFYRVQLDVATLAFSVGLIHVLRMRRTQGRREGTASIAMLAGVIVVMVLLNQWPYRTFSHRDFERVQYAGSRCYITGESGDEFLVLCPSNPPPRNTVVKRTDPALQRTGIIENVFRGVAPPDGGN